MLRKPLENIRAFQTAALIVLGLALILSFAVPFCLHRLQRQEPDQSVLVYEVRSRSPEMSAPVDMQSLVERIDNRLNCPDDRRNVVRCLHGALVEVQVDPAWPGEAARIDRLLTEPRRVEFRLIADRRDHPHWTGEDVDRSDALRDAAGRVLARWARVRAELASGSGAAGVTARTAQGGQEVLVLEGHPLLTGQSITSALVMHGSDWMVTMWFDAIGTELLKRLTSQKLPQDRTDYPRYVAVLIDGIVTAVFKSAPANSRELTVCVSSESGATTLAADLNASELPFTFVRVESEKL